MQRPYVPSTDSSASSSLNSTIHTPPTKTFSFTVGPDGQFIYDPPTDWAYRHDDHIRFQTESGPFTIDFLPASPIPIPGFNPLGGPLESVEDSGFYRAETTVTDALTDEDRETLMQANVSKAAPFGFVGRYFYDIKVMVNKQQFSDNQKNGSYSC